MTCPQLLKISIICSSVSPDERQSLVLAGVVLTVRMVGLRRTVRDVSDEHDTRRLPVRGRHCGRQGIGCGIRLLWRKEQIVCDFENSDRPTLGK